jgi:hypothetical protein
MFRGGYQKGATKKGTDHDHGNIPVRSIHVDATRRGHESFGIR